MTYPTDFPATRQRDTARPSDHNPKAPKAWHALGLEAHVIACDRFHGFGDEWTIQTHRVRGAWIIQPADRVLIVGELGELDLARYVAAERQRARQHLTRLVASTRSDLGLPPASARLIQRPKCRGCGTRPAQEHAAYSTDCNEAKVERVLSQRE